MAKTLAPERPPTELDRGPRYHDDFFLWSRRQAELIRSSRLELVDLENVAEEIESLGKRDRRELGSRLAVLTAHLLKWQFQPSARSSSWRDTIEDQREDLAAVLQDSPSLRREVAGHLDRKYAAAVRRARKETKFARGVFPESCPYTADEVLDPDFWPGPADQP